MSVGAGLQAVVTFLAAHGATLAIGVSCVLLGGSLGLLLQRDPRARRTIGSWTALGLVVYLVLALVPMTRWSLPQWPATAAAAATPPAMAELIGPLPPTALLEPVSAGGPLLAAVPEVLRTADISTAPELAAALPSTSTPELVAWVWLLGAALSAAWLLLGRLLLAGLLRHTRSGPEDLAQAADLPPRARLRLLDRPIAPFCCGLFRPSVVLHASLTAPERRNQALAVLRHEGAHLRAGDLRVQALFACLLPVLWWHPLYWLMRSQARFCAELLADAAAASSSGVHGYVRELLDLAEGRALVSAAAPALSVFRRRSEFSRRIEMLLQLTLPWSPSPSFLRRSVQALTTSGLVALSAGWFGVAPAPAQEPAPGAELRRENQQLQEEITRLRASLDALKARVAQLPDPAPTAASVMELLQHMQRAQAANVNVNPAAPGVVGNLLRDADILQTIRAQPTQDPAVQQGAEKTNVGVNRSQQAEVDRINKLIQGARQTRQSQDPLDQAIRNHTVKSGDSLDSIVRDVYGPGVNKALVLERVQALNPDIATQNLRIGQQVNLPPSATAQDPVRKTAEPPYQAQERDIERINRPINEAKVRQQQADHAPEGQGGSYQVQPGDTVESIARKLHPGGAIGPTAGKLLELNPGLDAKQLRVGQLLAVPETNQNPFLRTPRQSNGQPRSNEDPTALLELATRTIQLRGEIEVLGTQLQRQSELAKGGLASAHEVQSTEVRLRSAKQSLNVAQRLVEAEIEAATDEIKELKAAQATTPGEDAQRIERRLRLVSRRLEALVQAR